MKIFALLATIATVSAVNLNKEVQPENYKADPLWNFDDKHFSENKVDSLFPDHKPIPNKATVWKEKLSLSLQFQIT